MRSGGRLWPGLVIAGMMLMACSPGRELSVDEVIANMQQAEAEIADYHALVETALIQPGSDERVLAQEIWRKGPNQLRAEVRAGPAEMIGQVVVFDGKQTWFYDPLLKQEQIVPLEASLQLPQDQLGTVMSAAAAQLLEQSTVSCIGEETVAGRSAYRIELVPRSGTDLSASLGKGPVTIWVDEQHARRLRVEMPLPGGAHYTMAYRTIEYNVGLPDSLFQFNLAPGMRMDPGEAPAKPPSIRGMTLDAARRAARFPLRLPAHLPAGMSFAEATVVEGGGAVTLIYAGYGGSLSITEARDMGAQRSERGEEVDVQGATGHLRRQGDRLLSLQWAAEGLVFFITGTVPPAEALEVARSMQ